MKVEIGQVSINDFLTQELSKLNLEHWYATMSGTVYNESWPFWHFVGRRVKVPIWKFWERIFWKEKFDVVASLHNEPHRNFYDNSKGIRVRVVDGTRLHLVQTLAMALEKQFQIPVTVVR